ncbi:MAG: nuclear transport factor 2 family protein [Gammaproteobacteria bacterium]|jgi:predicted SnoaL-like aldol condensation-catalyzing enzyme|nr:nuclear transport factor 2 family protein [Gammaproteobacteria bacterium]
MKQLLAIIMLTLFSTTVLAQLPVEVIPANQQEAWLQDSNAQDAADKELVYDFWRLVLVARDMDAAMEMMHEDYMQHNPNIPTGRAPFIGFFGSMDEQEPLAYIPDLVAITADAGYVTMAFKREMDNPNAAGTYTTTWFDMFRVQGDVIIEHWDYGTIQAR